MAVVAVMSLLVLLDADGGCRRRSRGRSSRLLACPDGLVDGCGHDIDVGDDVTLVGHGERASDESSGDNGGAHCGRWCCGAVGGEVVRLVLFLLF